MISRRGFEAEPFTRPDISMQSVLTFDSSLQVECNINTSVNGGLGWRIALKSLIATSTLITP